MVCKLAPVRGARGFLVTLPLAGFGVFGGKDSLGYSGLLTFAPNAMVYIPVQGAEVVGVMGGVLFHAIFVFGTSFDVFGGVVDVPSLSSFS